MSHLVRFYSEPLLFKCNLVNFRNTVAHKKCIFAINKGANAPLFILLSFAITVATRTLTRSRITVAIAPYLDFFKIANVSTFVMNTLSYVTTNSDISFHIHSPFIERTIIIVYKMIFITNTIDFF